MAHDQLVVGHGQHISGQQDAAHGDLPVVGAPVDVDADGLVAVGAGEADLVVQGVLELDIAQAQGLVLFAQLAQTLEVELQLHFKRLGQLRKKYEALRLGDIKFQYALNNQISFTRTYGDQTIRIYVNRGSDDWEIPVGRILLARNMLTVADDQLVMGHNGFCIVEAV